MIHLTLTLVNNNLMINKTPCSNTTDPLGVKDLLLKIWYQIWDHQLTKFPMGLVHVGRNVNKAIGNFVSDLTVTTVLEQGPLILPGVGGQ